MNQMESASNPGPLAVFVGVSRSVDRVLRHAKRAAASRETVLLEGSTGTGKDLLARVIHDESMRHGGPFIAINCGALGGLDVEDELLGERDAGNRDRGGDLARAAMLARGGTLFLDTIGEASPALQASLLQFLETHQPCAAAESGGLAADIRIVAASSSSLASEVKKGKFCAELHQRLRAVRIRLPTLAERREDIPHLVVHLLDRLCRPVGQIPPPVSTAAMAFLEARNYPGNVRELENLLQRALVLLGQGRMLRKRHLLDVPRKFLRARAAS